MGDSEATTISKLGDNAQIRGTLAYMYLVE